MRLLFFNRHSYKREYTQNRNDNLFETLERKFIEVNQIIEEYKIDFLLHGGDLFDRPDVSISIVNRFASIINSIKVPIYIISGNHDIYGHNPQTINRTMLGLLDALGVVKVIRDEEKKYF